MNWIGLRAGSETQKLTSLLKTIALLAFVVACFAFGGQTNAEGAVQPTSAAPSAGVFASLAAFVLAFQLVLGTYDGWYSPIYFSEEDTNPTQNLPRSIFGGIFLVIAIYLLVNAALLYVLPMAQLADSKFAGGDAMSLLFGARSGQILTILALLSLIGIINAIIMATPRILFALGREGLFTKKAAVNKGGTPVFALAITALCTIILSSIGSFELLLALGQFFAVTITILLIVALFILRRREPDTPRPFRAWGYPFAPFVMLVFAVLLFFGYIISNPYPSLYALGILAVSYPIFRLLRIK